MNIIIILIKIFFYQLSNEHHLRLKSMISFWRNKESQGYNLGIDHKLSFNEIFDTLRKTFEKIS